MVHGMVYGVWYMQIFMGYRWQAGRSVRRKTRVSCRAFRGPDDSVDIRKLDQTFLFPLCIFSWAALVFFPERDNNDDCSNFLILHGFLWPPLEKQQCAEHEKQQRFPQGY